MAKQKIKSIAIMTGGGDCPGLNAVIRAVTKTAMHKYGLDVWGIEDGYLGLIENRLHRLNFNDVSNILNVGGTILGTTNKANPFKFPCKQGSKTVLRNLSSRCIKAIKERGIDAVVIIGGDGTMISAAGFAKKGLTVMGVPKTIDNDLYGTDVTFGFNTAVTTATDALDKIHTTAGSHHRVMIVEVMGRYAGWIALYSGVASGSDVILIPEIPYKLDKICRFVTERSQKGKSYSIIVAAEGAKEKGGKMVIAKKLKQSPDPIRLGGIANQLSIQIHEKTGLDCRAVALGHVQRGGTPTAYDRALATGFGYKAIELLMAGVKNHLVVEKGGLLESIPLSRVAGKIKKVPLNHPLIQAAKAVRTSFGL